LYSLTVFRMSAVTVPARGLGIRPTRTEHLPERADQAHHVGGCDADVEIGPSVLDLLGEVVGADLLGPSRPSLVSHVALGEHDDALRLADAVGQARVMPRTIWSACFGSMPSRMWISTVWSNFAGGNFFSDRDRPPRAAGPASVWGFTASIARMRSVVATVMDPSDSLRWDSGMVE
jgi:hypothetical protein